MAEARYVLLPWLMLTVRFENLNPNFGLAFNRATLRSTILARSNARFILQGVFRCNGGRTRVRDFAVMSLATIRAFSTAWSSPSGCNTKTLFMGATLAAAIRCGSLKQIVILPILWLSLSLGLAWGGEIAGNVKWQGAQGYSNAVIYAEKVPKAPVSPPKKPVVLDQIRLSFVPHVLPVVVGTTVSFSNSDEVGHNVYSSSPAKRFNLGVYPRGVARQITFDQPGEVVLLCNVHEQMSAYVLVLETPYYIVTTKDGNYRLGKLPPGRYSVTAWQEEFQSVAHPVEIKGDEMIRLDFSLTTRR